MQRSDFNRRTFLATSLKASLAVAPTVMLSSHALVALAATPGKQIFSILHTNDMHSTVVGGGRCETTHPLNWGMAKPRAAMPAALIAQHKVEP